MRWAVVLLLLGACRKSPPAWPADLTADWHRLDVKRDDRQVGLELTDGGWRLSPPRRGDADPDSVDRLRFALKAPQVLAARPAGEPGPSSWEIVINAKRRVIGTRTGLDPSMVVRVDDGEFTVSSAELGNKVPDPEEFLTPGLWVAARRTARRFTLLDRPHRYDLEGEGEDWRLVDGGVPHHELDDYPGIVIGRQAIGHPSGALETLGLDPPTARARVCVTSGECREFLFGRAGDHFYAVAPDSDPIELRASDWALVVNGP